MADQEGRWVDGMIFLKRHKSQFTAQSLGLAAEGINLDRHLREAQEILRAFEVEYRSLRRSASPVANQVRRKRSWWRNTVTLLSTRVHNNRIWTNQAKEDLKTVHNEMYKQVKAPRRALQG